MTKVSVVIPTYNSSDTIVGSINSILTQSYKDFGCIVVKVKKRFIF